MAFELKTEFKTYPTVDNDSPTATGDKIVAVIQAGTY